ncbi:cathepsin L-like peptidase [Diadema antillarum]|uniref:cathepsin L-like peptidase n=1 Tax=Diadema antillarum TaxID=105358 RepID=UPI003A84CD3D
MKYLSVLILAACLLGVFGAFEEEWTAWKLKFGKVYADDFEESKRSSIWRENLEIVTKHNVRYDLGEFTYKLGINEYSDLQNHEFVELMTGYRRNISSKATTGSVFLAPENVQIPDSVDWRTKGYVTAVKNQQHCGSCWAFSATGSLEGQQFRKTGKLVSLSEQNLVDCSGPEGNNGCNGGLPVQAFQYVIDSNGIDTEESYPYEGQDGPCRFSKSGVGATCTGYTNIASGNESALKEAVATVGPISVGIDASHDSFRHYESGIYNEPDCSSWQLQHAVLAVGYSSDKGDDYWIVKNSWGTSWGMDGYIWMSRNKDNQCGIATKASYPLV